MKISFLKIILILAFVFFLSSFVVSAGTEHNMSGWAFSSNIGLISFNCTNVAGSCDTYNYGVNQDTNGNLVGYAFSSNIGWIQFGCPTSATCLSGFPSQGSEKHDALVVSGKLTGWAKAIGADGNDWDGWISLSGIDQNYGVTIDQTTGKFFGYAWGSDVIGIVNFDGVVVLSTPTGLIPTAGGCGTKEIIVTWTPSVGATSYTLKVDGNLIPMGSATTYTHANLYVPSSHNYSIQTIYRSGSSLFSDPPISENAPVACSVRGECSSPANHLNPCSKGNASAILSSPSKWTWTCKEDTSSGTCSENNVPGYKEN